MHSDPIADLLTRIRNGCQARMISVDVPHSKIKVEIVKLLQAEGYVESYEVTTESKFPNIRVVLKYDNRRRPLIHELKRVSKPGLRVYSDVTELKPIRNGLATRIITTNMGLMTDREARRRKIGGEVLCEVY
ncbi:MAG: 30S ribosomal protein S8 [Fimbriimonas sp.]|jgi:small subunit ribosomal protein S8|nr:30S ribosomal protein S8 [Fimbriimonas sp.]